MKKIRWIFGVLVCAGLVGMITGSGIFYARQVTAYREAKIKPTATQRLSVFTEIRDKGQFRLSAQKGLSAKAPENSLEAVRMAGEAGFQFVQLDVVQTKDGMPMLLYDRTVDRMTDGTGRLGQFTAEQASELVLDNGANIDIYKGIHIPQLKQALQVCADYGMTAWISVQSLTDGTQFLSVLQESPVSYRLFSARKDTLTKLRQMGEKDLCFVTGALTRESLRYAEENGFSLAFDPENPANTEDVLRLFADRLQLYAWGVTDRTTLRRMEKAGIRDVVTDRIIPVKNEENSA